MTFPGLTADATPEQVRVWRDLCRRSLWATARIICGYEDIDTDLHHELCADVEQVAKGEGRQRRVYILPRGHLKSSIIIVAFSIFYLINHPNAAILLWHATSGDVRKYIQEIQTHIEGAAFQALFPELVPDKRSVWWDKTHVTIARTKPRKEPSITGIGAHSKTTGDHYDLILVDDLIDDEAARKSSEIEARVNRFRHLDPLLVRPGEDPVVVVGTPWVKGDVLHFAMESGLYQVYHRGLYGEPGKEEGTPIWPERFSPATIELIRKNMGDFRFRHQYLCTYLDAAMHPIPPTSIRFYRLEHREGVGLCAVNEPDDPERFEYPVAALERFLTHDPSLGKKSSDMAATIVTGLAREDGRVFVLEAKGQRIPPDEQLRYLARTGARWRLDRLHIEAAALQAALIVFFRNQIARERLPFTVEELKPAGVNKGVRISALVPFFDAGQVYLLREHGDLERQLIDFSPLSYSGSKNRVEDDLVDALAYQVPFWRGLGVPDDDEGEDYNEWEDEAPPAQRGATGYGF